MSEEEILQYTNVQSPYNVLSGTHVDVVKDGVSQTTMILSQEQLNMMGYGHGGFFFTLCDILSGTAVRSSLHGDKIVVTAESSISFYGNTTIGKEIRGKGWVTKKGKSLVFAEAEIRDENDKVIVAFHSIFAIK